MPLRKEWRQSNDNSQVPQEEIDGRQEGQGAPGQEAIKQAAQAEDDGILMKDDTELLDRLRELLGGNPTDAELWEIVEQDNPTLRAPHLWQFSSN
jgi:surfactin synthase thioesterase subunit